MKEIIWGGIIILLLVVIISGLSCIYDMLKQIRDKREQL